MNINLTLSDFDPRDYLAKSYWETQWLLLFSNGNITLTLTLFSFVMHELVYFGRYLPFLLCDYIPSLRKYKIQDTKESSPNQLRKCLKGLMFNHWCIQLPMMLGFHPLAEIFGMKIVEVPFPTWTRMILQITIFMIFEDAYHYFIHRLLHYGPFYKHIHKIHHEFSAPFGMAAEYAHPLETLILGFGTIGGPLIFVAITNDLHIITVLAWIMLRLFQTVDAHSGYDFPWSLRNWVPFWAGADHHDFHHMAFLGNYSTSFRFWDWLFGTNKQYLAYKQRSKFKKTI